MTPPVHAVHQVKDATYCGIPHTDFYGVSRDDTWNYDLNKVTCEDCQEEVAMEKLARLGWNEESLKARYSREAHA
jgi:hypothetical protein